MVRVRIGDDERELDWDEWERRVRDGRVPPDALVRLEAVTGDAFVPARTLESYQSLRNEGALAWQSGFEAAPPPLATALLVGVNLRIWWIARLPYPAAWMDLQMSNWTAPVLEDGESWRTLTMGILHLDAAHVAMNMLWLAYAGWNLERALGWKNLLLLYGASVLGGSLLSMFLSTEARSLGASGGVFGLVAAAVVFGFLRPELLPARGRRVFGLALLPYLVVMFTSGLSNEGIDNWAHFGGLVTGGALALVLDPELLQRRASWNRAWRFGVIGTSSALLLGLGLFGPRLAPTAPHEVVEAAQSTRPPGAPEVVRPKEALAWRAPSGWRLGVTATGEAGLASPSPRGDRAWAVREYRWDTPRSTESRAAEWTERVRAAFTGVVVGEPEPATLAGRPGLTVSATLPNDVEVRWWGVTRGRYGVEAVWQVESAREVRLRPLRERLVGSVRWDDPRPLAEARAVIERNPQSLRGRADLAVALADVGEPAEAMALYAEVIAADPENPDWVVGRLDVLAAYPDAPPDPDAVIASALATHPTPDVVVAVVDALDAAGRASTAEGLLEVAWVEFPGERTLRRTRRARAMPTAIDGATGLPSHLVRDPTTGRPLAPGAVEALRATSLDLPTAVAWGAARAARRADLAEEVRAALVDDPTAAVEPLLLLQHVVPPDDLAAARAGLLEDLRTLARGGKVAWIPSDLAPDLAVPFLAERIVR